MWNSIVKNTDVRNHINLQLNKIYNYIHDSELVLPLGTLGGYGGSLLFLYQMYIYRKDKKYLTELQERIQQLCTNIKYVELNSFCSGYAGICWLLRYFYYEGVFECDNIDEMLSDMDRSIYEELFRLVNNNDFLHGGLGMAYYFIYYKTPYSPKAISKYIEVLDKSKIADERGGYKWISDAYVREYKIGRVFNLGMAHGMASLIYFLAICIEKCVCTEQVTPMLNGVLKYYQTNVNSTIFASAFPYWILLDKKEYAESRLAWCYGDPGIASSIYHAGKRMHNQAIIDFSLEIFDRTLVRFKKELADVNESSICHGSAGLAIIYNTIYQETGLERYKDAAVFWLNDTIKKGEQGGPYAGHILPDSQIEENRNAIVISLINGISGIGLSLLSTISDDFPYWKECFMI